QESEAGSLYAGPYIAQSVEYDGLRQTVMAGDIPVTSQVDVQHMVNSLTARAAANALQVTAAALNLKQTLTGNFASAASSVSPLGLANARWVLDQTSLRVYDGTSNNYGAPSGPGVIAEFRADGRAFLGAGLTLQTAVLGPFMQLIASTPLFRI